MKSVYAVATASMLAGSLALAQPASPDARDVPAKVLPVPGTVSPQMQAIIAQPYGPIWNVVPKSPEEWKAIQRSCGCSNLLWSAAAWNADRPRMIVWATRTSISKRRSGPRAFRDVHAMTQHIGVNPRVMHRECRRAACFRTSPALISVLRSVAARRTVGSLRCSQGGRRGFGGAATLVWTAAM